MAINIKSRREIELMRRTGRLGQFILRQMAAGVGAGVSTMVLEEIARVELEKAGARALSKNYPHYKPGEGYPGHTCISVNEEVVHGIPGNRVLQEGDIVTLDLALMLGGYCADVAFTVPVGKVPADRKRLMDVTREALDLAVSNIKPGRKWSEVARIIQTFVERHGYNVVREFVGHGIGRSMHEDPKVPNFVTQELLRGDFRLKPGMTLAVEPMVVAGKADVRVLDDGWTMVTADNQPAAHFEHTIAVTETGCDVLTDGREVA